MCGFKIAHNTTLSLYSLISHLARKLCNHAEHGETSFKFTNLQFLPTFLNHYLLALGTGPKLADLTISLAPPKTPSTSKYFSIIRGYRMVFCVKITYVAK